MKRGWLVVVLLLISVCESNADTTWVQAGSVSGNWTAEHSPYMILGNVIIAAGDSLRINPGVIVDFAGPYSFTINGKLLARGTETDSIIFTTDTLANPDRWRGLRFVHADSTSRMEYCVVDRILGSNGGVYCENSFCRFDHCLLYNNHAQRGGGAYVFGGAPVFEDCQVIFNHASASGGGFYLVGTAAHLMSCRVDSNTTTGTCAGVAIVSQSTAHLECSTVSYNRSLAFSQVGAGIYCVHSEPSVIRCSIIGNSAEPPGLNGTGLFIAEGDAVVNSTIFAFNNGPALFFFDSTQIQANYCDFYGQDVAGGYPPAGLGTISAHNANTDPCDRFYNIFLDPQLADTAAGASHLLPTSPCIHAGDPALPRDPDETTADIGAFYYHRPYFWPSPFELLLPHNNDTLIDTSRVRFLWHESVDGDRGDTVTYTLFLQSGDSIWAFPAAADTFITVDLSVLSLDPSIFLNWWVQAHSQRPDGIVECVNRYRIYLESAGAAVRENDLPRTFALYENSPNPFNAVTAIRFDVPHDSRVKLIVYDILGRVAAVVQDGLINAGTHRVLFDAGALPSGVYFCRMTADDFSAVKKLLLVK